MKKFCVSALMFAICILSVNFCSAAKVRICDFGMDIFVSNYNEIAKSNNHQYFMKNPVKSQQDNSFYGMALNNQANGNYIFFQVNNDGCISSILVTNNLQDNGRNTIAALYNTLYVLGAEQDEIIYLLNGVTKNNFAYQWIKNLNRYVAIRFERNYENSGYVDCFYFFASDDETL